MEKRSPGARSSAYLVWANVSLLTIMLAVCMIADLDGWALLFFALTITNFIFFAAYLQDEVSL